MERLVEVRCHLYLLKWHTHKESLGLAQFSWLQTKLSLNLKVAAVWPATVSAGGSGLSTGRTWRPGVPPPGYLVLYSPNACHC